MTCRTDSFPRRTLYLRFALYAAVLASGFADLQAQAPPRPIDAFQKISFKMEARCSVPSIGEVTALIKNGVELSVTDDYDCDGIPDAYDNCVGMPNPDQADNNKNIIGDVCEAAVTIKTPPPVKPIEERSIAKKREPHDKRRSTPSSKRLNAKVVDKISPPKVKKTRRP